MASNKQADEKRQIALERSVRSIFRNIGMEEVVVKDKYKDYPDRPKVEHDLCFIDENIIIFCELTISHDSKHVLTKNESATACKSHRDLTLNYLRGLAEDKAAEFLRKYDNRLYVIEYMYFTDNEVVWEEDQRIRYKSLNLVDSETRIYLIEISKTIKRSAKFELFRYLNLKCSDYAPNVDGAIQSNRYHATILAPDSIIGRGKDLYVVTFMMSAKKLIELAYVMRKDSWAESVGAFQRMVQPKKIRQIRDFISDDGKIFLNNIIVGMPSDLVVMKNGQKIDISELAQSDIVEVDLPNNFNSISVIDGQHRLYSFYDDPEEKDNSNIQKFSSSKCLLVTGIIYPTSWSDNKKISYQSEVFLEINNTPKKLDRDLILHLEAVRNPHADTSLALSVLRLLNSDKNSPFHNKFILSATQKIKNGIKTASIVQYGLRHLVSIHGEYNLSQQWARDNDISVEDMRRQIMDDSSTREGYVRYCAVSLSNMFKALRRAYPCEWDDPSSSINRSVTINAFILALRDHLKLGNSLPTHEEYFELMKSLDIDFKSKPFPYSGSQYGAFSKKIVALFPSLS